MRRSICLALGLTLGCAAAADADAWQTLSYPYENRVFDLAIEGSTIWLATHGDGLVGYDGTTWVAHRSVDEGIRQDDWNYTLFVDAASDKWIGRDGDQTVDRLDDAGTFENKSDDTWTYYSHPTELEHFRVFSMAEDGSGNKWFGMRDENHYIPGTVEFLLENDPDTQSDDDWFHFDNAWTPDSTSFSDDDVRAVAVDGEGRLWIGYYATGVDVWDHGDVLVHADTTWAYADDDWRHYDVGSGLPSNLVHTIHAGPDGRVWVGTLGGLAVYDPASDSWSTITGLPGSQARAIDTDAQGHVWVGTDDGVAMLYASGAVALTFGVEDGIANELIDALAVDRQDGRVWALSTDQATQETALSYYDSGFGPQSGLMYVYPNPWNASETSQALSIFGVPEGSKVEVFDIAGERVRELGRTEPYTWDTLDADSLEVPSGVYILRVETPAGDLVFVKAAVLR